MILPDVVATFERLFGDKPRVHLLEALLRLAPVTFTRAEWAQEAGLHKGSTNRLVADLEKEGFVRRVTEGSQPEYAVALENAYVRILGALEAALELVEMEGPDSPVAQDAAEAFRRSVVTTVLAANNVPTAHFEGVRKARATQRVARPKKRRRASGT